MQVNSLRHLKISFFTLLACSFLTLSFAQTYQQAPQLAEQVAAGTLPDVAERLPAEPLVVPVLEEIGTYGGDLRVALVGGNSLVHMWRYHAYDWLLRYSPDWEKVIPNVAESYEISEDGTTFTFHLREGMKWSDGAPFSADDIMFWYNDMLLNPDITPTIASMWLNADGTPVVVEKIDDYTVQYTFKEPKGLFLSQLASVESRLFPKHYFSQFHINYNENAEADAIAAGADSWASYFLAKGGSGADQDYFGNPDMPVLTAWKITVAPGASTNRAIAERNPYYWKVDEQGNQLPYIDRIVYNLVEDNEVALLNALNGEIDMQDQFIATDANKPVLFDNQENGNYHFFSTTPTAPNAAVIQFNLSHPDPVKREMFRNKDFRIGLSYALNREEIIDIVYAGQAEPHQAAPRPESELYNETLAKQYTEYDPDLANEYLDKAGYTERDAQGYRLGPDGNRISFLMELDAARDTFIDAMQLITEYWADVGVEVQTQTLDRSLWDLRVRNNAEFDASIHRFGGGVGQVVYLDPRYYFPFNANSLFADGWQKWYNDPTQERAEEPSDDIKRQMELYDQIKTTPDEAKQAEMMKEILEIAVEQFYTIGISTEPIGYGVVNNDLKNVPASMPWSFTYPHPAPTNPEQWFYSSN